MGLENTFQRLEIFFHLEILFQEMFNLLFNYLTIREKNFSMKEINKLVAEAVKNLSTKQKEDLAAKLGITRRTLDNVSAGKTTPDIDQLGILGDELGIDIIDRWKLATGRKIIAADGHPPATPSVVEERSFKINFSVKVMEKSTANLNDFISDIKLVCTKHDVFLD